MFCVFKRLLIVPHIFLNLVMYTYIPRCLVQSTKVHRKKLKVDVQQNIFINVLHLFQMSSSDTSKEEFRSKKSKNVYESKQKTTFIFKDKPVKSQFCRYSIHKLKTHLPVIHLKT